MNPKEYKYTEEHEWIGIEADGTAKMGITDYAQSQLGDLVFFDLPQAGVQMTQSRKMGEIESVKAVSELFAPAGGKVLEVNQKAVDDPAIVNEDPYGEGWLVRLELSDPSELDTLMSSEAYDKFIAELLEE